jgi:adenylate cyclase
VLRLEGLVAQVEEDGPGRRQAARRCFEAASRIARRQGARALELRAATCLARLMIDEEDTQRAVDALANVRSRFRDGSDTQDLERADIVLRSLITDTHTVRPSDSR